MKKLFGTLIVVILALTAWFSISFEPAMASTAVPIYNDSSSLDGKRIMNQNLLSAMSMFPEHDQNNGCGMVAMGVLLQFYNELGGIEENTYLII